MQVKLNPTIQALDRKFNVLYTKQLSDIQGMAYGVREDFEQGDRRITFNQCYNNASKTIAWWMPV